MERRPDLVVADVTDHGADVDDRTRFDGERGEDAGGGGDDESFDREQVLALEFGLDADEVAPEPVEQLVEVVGRRHGDGARSIDRPLGHSGQHAAGAQFGEVVEHEDTAAPTVRAHFKPCAVEGERVGAKGPRTPDRRCRQNQLMLFRF